MQIPTMLTIKETAKALKLPEGLIRHKVYAGEIYAIKTGKKYLINLEKAIAYLNGDYRAPEAAADPEEEAPEDQAADFNASMAAIDVFLESLK